MSYADIAAKGPEQSPEEKMAPPVPEIAHDEESVGSSLVDVDSPHVNSVPSDFEEQKVKTQTQATRLEHEAEDKARAASKKASDLADKAKKEASADAKKAKKELKKDAAKLSENRDNPVVIGNAVLWGITAVVLGVCSLFASNVLHGRLTNVTGWRIQQAPRRKAGLETGWISGRRCGCIRCGRLFRKPMATGEQVSSKVEDCGIRWSQGCFKNGIVVCNCWCTLLLTRRTIGRVLAQLSALMVTQYCTGAPKGLIQFFSQFLNQSDTVMPFLLSCSAEYSKGLPPAL